MPTTVTWRHASLSLTPARWPGTRPVRWVAATAAGELFRADDLVAALDRLGADGWELTAFMPEWADRSATFLLKRPAQ